MNDYIIKNITENCEYVNGVNYGESITMNGIRGVLTINNVISDIYIGNTKKCNFNYILLNISDLNNEEGFNSLFLFDNSEVIIDVDSSFNINDTNITYSENSEDDYIDDSYK